MSLPPASQPLPDGPLRLVLRLGGSRLLRRVADVFEISARNRLQIMTAALDQPGCDGFQLAAHGLRGSAVQVGAASLAALCTRAEAMADFFNADAARELVGAMRSEVNTVLQSLRQALEGTEDNA